jgi:hypothetical protein
MNWGVKIRHVQVNDVVVIEPADAARPHIVDTNGCIEDPVTGKEVSPLKTCGIEQRLIVAHVDLITGDRVRGGKVEVHIHEEVRLGPCLDRGQIEGGRVACLGRGWLGNSRGS